MYLTSELSPSRSMPFEIEPITTAPSSADQTEPRPPNRLVPAITGPAIAKSRMSPDPEAWFTAISLDAARIPPAAAIVEAIVKTAIRRPPTASAPYRARKDCSAPLSLRKTNGPWGRGRPLDQDKAPNALPCLVPPSPSLTPIRSARNALSLSCNADCDRVAVWVAVDDSPSP